jgi:putative ABC transport system permease protein
MISEARYLLRSLRRRKGFAMVTVLTIALGIGAATAVYSIVDWILFNGPESPRGLYAIGLKQKGAPDMVFTWEPFYEAYSSQSQVFSETCAGSSEAVNVAVENKPVSTGVFAVTPNFFSMLGVKPALGRTFFASEAADGRDNVVVVSHQFWKRHMGGSNEALGRLIRVDRTVCSVIGILPEGQRFPVFTDSDVYKPFVLHYKASEPWEPFMVALGRTRPGMTRERAEELLAKVRVDIPEVWKSFGESARPGLSTVDEMQKIFRPEIYWTLVGAVAFLYGIASLNATNLILVHVLGKRLEISVRLALGGSRWGVLRLLLIEVFGLCICGMLLGALVANWLIPLLDFLAGYGDPNQGWASWYLDWKTYLVLAGLTLVTGALIAVVPALQLSRLNLQAGLKAGGGAIGESPRLARVRGLFVVLQATFAVILLVGAGLMIRSFQRLEEVPLGFDPTHRVKMQLNFPRNYYSAPDERMTLLNRIRESLLRLPSVSSVAFGSQSILAGIESATVQVEAPDGTSTEINNVYVSSDFAEAGGMVLKWGRWLQPDTKSEILVNESYARARFGTPNAVGRHIRAKGSSAKALGWEIVGVVADVREKMRDAAKFRVYMPIKWSPNIASTFFLHMKGEPDGEALGRLTQAIYSLDPRIIVYTTVPMTELRNQQLYSERLALSVLRVLACIATALAVVGLFSVLAYTVDRRMPEFGIRMALGATPRDLVALVMRRGIALTVLGIAIGIGGAAALTRFLQSLLFETPGFDPVVVGCVSALLLLAAFAASIIPSVRASKPDLVSLLKSD